MNLLFDSTEHLAFFTPYWMERLCNTPLLLMHKYAIYQSWNTCDRTGCIFNALNIQHNNQKSFDDLFYIVLWSASHIFSGVIETNNSFNMDSYFVWWFFVWIILYLTISLSSFNWTCCHDFKSDCWNCCWRKHTKPMLFNLNLIHFLHAIRIIIRKHNTSSVQQATIHKNKNRPENHIRVIMSKVKVWIDISQSNDADACQIHITFPLQWST